MKTSPVYELKSDEYNTKLAEILKSMPEFKAPGWSAFVKTGISRQRPPVEDDFWYKRAASILRQIYVHRVTGVNRLRTRYGSRLNRGMRPERFRRASGKIIRTILQQAEAAGLIEKYNEPGKRAGRILTLKGKEFLDSVGNGKQPTPTTDISKPLSNVDESKPAEEKKANEDVEEVKEEAIKIIEKEK
jgi:small subunit ribosomal protein S19e